MKKLMAMTVLSVASLASGLLRADEVKGDLTDRIRATCEVVKCDEWYGGRRTVFKFQGHEAWVVEPPAGVAVAEGNPWTWTIQWWTAFVPRTGVPQLLKKGFRHVMIDMFETRGTDEALPTFAAYQKFLVDELGFAPKTKLIGMSWGGFFSTRYAAHYPQNVDRIYLDCPFLNLGGSVKGKVGIGPWEKMKPENWIDDPRMPINLVKPIAEAKIPILLAYGGADDVLDPKLNSEIFIPRFKAAGGDIKVIYRKPYGHHPHGFEESETTVVDFFTKGAKPAAVELPGEKDTKLAISPAPFPDRMSAYVWKNWLLVPHDRLARVVSAKESDLEAMAVEMGLPAKVDVQPEWRRKGYITVLRRNWHLLPYDQLMTVLDMTREELRFSLIEDDFLWHKLGLIKPKCEPLVWREGMRDEGQEMRRRIAGILKAEGLDPVAPEEPRFAFVRELAKPQPGWKPAAPTDSPFAQRVIFSYFADYADPLWDNEIGSFPEGLLQRLADQGVNGVWLHPVLRTLVKDPKYPEFGEGCERRLSNLQKLVVRCARYGIKVYLYMNEPRGMEPSFFDKPGRESLGGAVHGELRAMCTSCPETHRWVRESLRRVFSTVHGLGGIFTITASENLTNCATRPKNKETCPRCKNRTRADIICEATSDLIAGMQAGDPNAEALVYSWAWEKEDLEKIIAGLPKGNVRIMSVSERHMPLKRGGVPAVESDYSISVVGPGAESLDTWRLAKANGAGVLAKVQACNSWEISSFPYIPTMDLVAQHAVNLANAGVDGVMLSWSLGCYPAVSLSVYRDLRAGEKTIDPMLDRLAAGLYGKDKVARARQAWTAFSEGFSNFPFSCSVIYNGPQQWGPANPLYLKPTGYRATMVGFPYDAVKSWCAEYPPEIWIDLMQKVADGFEKGCSLMEGVASEKELNLFRGEWMDFASCADQARFVLARDRGDKAEMKRLAQVELERAKRFLPIVRADSRIGFESSNQYFYVPIDIIEKIVGCRLIVDSL